MEDVVNQMVMSEPHGGEGRQTCDLSTFFILDFKPYSGADYLFTSCLNSAIFKYILSPSGDLGISLV